MQTRCASPPGTSCATCLRVRPSHLDARIDLLCEHYAESADPWIVAYSGGKDSSAVLKLVYEAMRRVRIPQRKVDVVYCDTGVEIPVVREHVRSTFRKLRAEAKADGLPLRIKIAEPRVEDRFFVKVIGRGYPPPTNKFRWCTDRLRISPIRRLLASMRSPAATVLVGTRNGESAERDRILARYRKPSERFFFEQSGSTSTRLFAPIVDFSVPDVWSALLTLRQPVAVDGPRVLEIYKDAGADCPVVRDEHGTACGNGRFGCWTCTVVRKDKAVTSLVNQGYDEMEPLLGFRNWLAAVRDEPSARCNVRRNGAPGPGPLTLEARKEALRRLRRAERDSGLTLISSVEVDAIRSLWRLDRASPTYQE